MCKLLCSLWTSFIKVWEQFNFKFFKVYFMEIKRKIESTQLKSEICSLLHSFNWKNWNRILDSTISCWSGNKPSLLSRAVSSRGEAREWPKSSLINYMIVKFCPVFLTIMYMYDWIWFPSFFFPVLRSGVVSQARGSAYIEMQRTKVTCAVYPFAELSRVQVTWMLASWGISKLPLVLMKLSLDHIKSME